MRARRLPSKTAMRAAKQIENMALGESDTLQISKDAVLHAQKKEGRMKEEDTDGDGRKVEKKGHVVDKQNPVC